MGDIDISLPVYEPSGHHAMDEHLPATSMGNNCYRLRCSPGLVEGVAAGDEIEVIAVKPGFRVLRRSGNLCVWLVAAAGLSPAESNVDKVLTAALKKVGGYLDGGTSRVWVFTVPVRAGFEQLKQIFDSAVQRGAVTWFYGNVYDPDEPDKPLNWWNETA